MRRAAFLAMALWIACGWASSAHAQTQGSGQGGEQGVLAGFVSRLLSTPTAKVTVGAVDGALSSDAAIRDIAVADDQGVYLTVDRVRLTWRRAALLQRRLEVQRLEIGRITLLRRPTAATGEPEPGPLLPELPLSLRIDAFQLAELVLGQPVLGVSARLAAEGSASLESPAIGLQARLAIRRLDAPGTAELALGYIPQGDRLGVRLTADEPAGGVLARLAGLPDAPPVRIDLTGDGALDDFTARLTLEAGPDVGASGGARLARSGAERLLTLDLSARIAPLLPAVARPVFAGVTTLSGGVAIGDDGAVRLRDVRLGAPLAELTLSGVVSADRRLDLKAGARALPDRDGVLAAAGARLARLSFEAAARGPYAAPAIEGSLDAAGIETPDFALASLGSRFRVVPRPSADTGLDFEASAQVRGFRPAEDGLDAAFGRDLSLVLAGDVDAGGVASFRQASVASPTLSLGYVGRLGRRMLEGDLRLDALDLAAFSRLAGRPLRGRARIGAKVSGDPERRSFVAAVDGRTSGLATGDARLDRLLGESLRLDGGLGYAGGALTLRALRASGAAANVRLDGAASAEALSLSGAAEFPDLSAIDGRLAGRAEAALRLTGPTADPSVAIRLTAPEARALGRPVRGLDLSLDAARALTTPNVAASGRGTVGGKPLKLDARLSVDAPDRDGRRNWTIERLRAALGSVALDAAGRATGDGLLDGRAALEAGDLDDVSPLLLTPLGGRLSAEFTARAEGDAPSRGQSLTLKGSGERLSAAGARIASFTADFTADDLYRRPVLRGQVRAADVSSAGLTLDAVALTAADGGGGTSAVSLEGRGGGFLLAAAAKVRPGPPTIIDLASFRATRSGRVIALAAPASIVAAEGGLRTNALALDVAGGRVSIAGLIGRDLDLSVSAASLPLAAADIVAPGLGLTGTAAGRLSLKGPAAAPDGAFDISLRGAGSAAARAAGLPLLDVTARGALARGRAEIEARLAGGKAVDLRVTGSAGLGGDRRLDLKARGALDAALLNPRLAAGGQRAAGRIAIDAAISGDPGAPRLGGSATLSAGSFTDALRGVAVEGIAGRLVADGSSVAIERLSGRTRDGGALTLSGRVSTDAARSFPGDLKLTARNARLIDSGLARLVADADLTIAGPLAAAPRIAGRIGVKSLDVRVPERLGGAAEPLRDARHIAPPPQVRARLAKLARASASPRRAAPPFQAALDVQIDAPARVFVRGRGLDAELGGAVRIAGTTLAPTAAGAFDLRRGRLSILSQRLDFSRGRMSFGGAGFVPELDFIAETRAGDVTARVAVGGPADQPTFAFSSSPALPEDEVLARLLFQRAAGGLSPLQAIQLAQTAAQLSGAGGPDAFEATRRALGVDDLDVGFAGGGPTLGLSRAIGDRARLNVKAGTKPETSSIGVDIDLTRRIRLQSEIGADGRASVGVGVEQEY